jgi:nucleoside-diphosphate kinase
MEQTFALIKPGFEDYWLDILYEITNHGFKIVKLKQVDIDNDLCDQLYHEHIGQDYYPPNKEYITSDTSVALILEALYAVSMWRHLMGYTNPRLAAPGTIRGIFARDCKLPMNCVHGSDSLSSANREIKLFFGEYKERKPA